MRMAMIAMTTKSSMSVNALRIDRRVDGRMGDSERAAAKMETQARFGRMRELVCAQHPVAQFGRQEVLTTRRSDERYMRTCRTRRYTMPQSRRRPHSVPSNTTKTTSHSGKNPRERLRCQSG